MASVKSLDEGNLIATLLHDVKSAHVDVFSHTSLEQTISIVNARIATEGISFLTKTLPKLGKMLDRALVSGTLVDACSSLRLRAMEDSVLPRLFGELFARVFDSNGGILPSPCVKSVRALRQLTYCFYKYELPYTPEQEHEVIAQFEKTEDDLSTSDPHLVELGEELRNSDPRVTGRDGTTMLGIVRRARRYLHWLFLRFDPLDIVPCHGPGVVATKQSLWAKYDWVNISSRITDKYPWDAYFCASLNAVCDQYKHLDKVTDKCLPARVLLVPKDSRGPRLISCEPVDFQWVQGGLRKAIVHHVENHPLTKGVVNFTDQEPNRQAALNGSISGSLATLDLKEASDRVSLELVRLLFPGHICEYLECCRSLSTVLPDGRELKLRKFAPMGSSLCFPIMALTIWALLAAAAPSAEVRRDLLVYGDDVVVPTGFTRDAIEVLEAFGLMVNCDKSCSSGLFRESCGLDSFAGEDVTPVRFRTVWTSAQSPNVYCSWIAYANSLYGKHYNYTYDYIVTRLHAVYGAIPSTGMRLACPSLVEVAPEMEPQRARTNHRFQKRQWWVWDIKAPRIIHESPGWQMLLRYFSEGSRAKPDYSMRHDEVAPFLEETPFRVRSYTRRGTSILVRRWR
jgi:hypothetical protein